MTVSGDLALRQLTIPGVLTATSWTPPDNFSKAQWEDAGEKLALLHQASAWWIGDWLRYGQDNGYIDRGRYDEAEKIVPRLSRGTLYNCAHVAKVIDSSRRREDLDFAHHQEVAVASLPPAEQDEWLERASSAHWPHKTLRSEVSKATRPELEPVELTYDFDRDRKRRQDAPDDILEAAQRLADEIFAVVENYDAETLTKIADYYEVIRPDGWLTQLIRQRVEMP